MINVARSFPAIGIEVHPGHTKKRNHLEYIYRCLLLFLKAWSVAEAILVVISFSAMRNDE